MRAFGAAGYLIGNARYEVRLVYTGFLVLVGIGMVTMALLQWAHVCPWPSQIAAYYRGGEREGVMTFGKTFRELVELTHFHGFIMGTVYLILAHLLVATTASEAVKRAAIVGGFAGLLGDVVGVWLIRYVSGAFAWWQLASWIAEWASFAAYWFYPIRDMWFTEGLGSHGRD